jgi:penicillin-binding protein 1A
MDNNNNIDMDRYFNDREYRKKISAERNKKKSFRDLFSKKVVKVGLITFSILFIALCGYVYYLFQGLPSIQELENPKTAIASEVRSRDGVVLDRYFVENRTYVSIDNISPHAIDALIATEDHRFFNHWGVDFQSLMRLPYYWLQQRFEGGSTISQQLARNLYRKIGFEVTVTRKLREMITAVQIESNYTKREIIEMYLNTVEFSNSAFGIESAAQTHYGKPASDLTLSESANLIGQLQAVYAYNPRLFPERAKTRRNIVLGQMQKHGFLTEEIFRNLSEEPIALNYQPPSKAGRESRYFGEYVRLKVEDWAEENGYDLYSDGLVIYTTIDSRLQKHAETAVQEKLVEFQETFENEWTSYNGDYMDELWDKYPSFLRSFIRETDRYKNAFSKLETDQESVVFNHLLADSAFVDSVKRVRTKLQASFTAIRCD